MAVNGDNKKGFSIVQKIIVFIGILAVIFSIALSLQIGAAEKILPGPAGTKDRLGDCICGGGDCQPCNFI